MYSAHMRSISSAPDFKSLETIADDRTFYNLFINFNRRHQRFHTPLPTIRGVTLNLYSFFTAVVKRGGYSKVTENNLWESVLLEIGYPSACVNSSVALRRIYCQYLVAFENESYPHLKSDGLWSQFQDGFEENSGDVFVQPSVERMLGIFNSKSLPIHYGMHRSASHLGCVGKDFYPTLRCNQNTRFHASSFDQLSPWQQLKELHSRPHPSNCFDLLHASVLATAEKSLMSGLPNEVDLSLNSMLFLSAVVHSSQVTPLRLSSSRNLLQLMLATVGIFEDGASSLRLLSQAWNAGSKLKFEQFWRDAVGDSVISSLLEDPYLFQEHSEPLVQDAETAGYRVAPPPSPDITHDLFSPSSSHARQVFGSTGSGCTSNDCLSSNAPLSRILTVVATLVNCITPPHLAGVPPLLEEDDDEIEQVMAFASVNNQHTASNIKGVNETNGRPFRGRSLFYAPGLIPPLSTWRENMRFLSSQPSVLRFAFLCAYARHSSLRQLGLQLIGGLRYPLNPTNLGSVVASTADNTHVPHSLHLNIFTGIELISLRFLVRCLLQSADRCDLLAGLSLLTNLLRVPEGVNVECLFTSLPRFLWCRLIQLLCLSDLGLVCAVLEALYTATGMGSFACTCLWSALASADDNASKCASSTVFEVRRASIHLRPLLALLSLEGQSMGPGSLHRVKVVQRQPQPIPTPMPPPTPPTPQMMSPYAMHQPPPFHPQYRPLQHPPSAMFRPQYLQQTPRCPPSLQPTSSPHLVPPRQRPTLPSSPRPTSSSLANLLSLDSASSSTATTAVSRGSMMPPQEVSSLSELTDRLQMPPPQMPPPRRISTKVNGSPTFSSVNRLSPLNGKNSSSLTNHRLPQCHQQLTTRKPSSMSLLEEVLNAPSSKVIPHLVNGCADRKNAFVSDVPSVKLVNGENRLSASSEQLPVRRAKSSLVNGVIHDKENANMMGKVDMEEDEKEEEENREAKLLEVATFFTHYLCFNHHVGFHYTRKRPRNFALRNRVLKSTISTSSDDTTSASWSSSSSSSSTKRFKIDLNNKSNKTALLPQRQPPLPQSSLPMFVCGWKGCLQRFPVVHQFSSHVFKSHLKPHLPSASTSSPIERHCCQWSDCSSSHLPRAPFALMSHVLERHCSSGELESLPPSTPVSASTAAVAPFISPSFYPATIGLPDPSGWAIVREMEARRLQADLWMSQGAILGHYYSPNTACGGNAEGGRSIPPPPPREGPVTKHLRVTAALILRNLAKHIPEARRWLLSETPLLCEIAMGTCPGASSLRTNDASRIIAQCLSICTSPHNLHDYAIADNVDIDELPYCYCDPDDFYQDKDDFCHYYEGTSGRLSRLQRLALLRQHSSVDLDA